MDKNDVSLEEMKLGIFNMVFTMLQQQNDKHQSLPEAKKIVTNYLKDIIETINTEDRQPEGNTVNG